MQELQAVGQALRKNPFAPDVPCHRVVGADGKLCGFKGKSTGFTLQEKRKMLEREGIQMEEGSISRRDTSMLSCNQALEADIHLGTD
jgi:alkylated DNA nucleotide flippase Atl1